MIECKCGCSKLINERDKRGRPVFYIKGHGNRNRHWKQSNPRLSLYKDRHDYNSQYSKENRENERERHEKFRESNPDYYKNWYKKNKQKAHEYYLRIKEIRYTKHKEAILKRNKAYKKLHPELDLIRIHKRRAKCKSTDLTLEFLRELKTKTKICELCDCIMDDSSKLYPNGKQLDHIIPLYVGGTHTKNNVRYICFKCNTRRPKDGSDIFQINGKVIKDINLFPKHLQIREYPR